MSSQLSASLSVGILTALVTLSASAMDRGPPRSDGPGYRQYVDTRYDHDHTYPRRGQFVRELPRERVVVFDRGHRPYYQYNGAWYAPRRSGFVVVGPPIGAFVSVLPPFYTTVWFSGMPYYYANDTYYSWRERDRTYEVVDAPADTASTSSAPAQTDEPFVYPKNGQSSDQQARDRYECHHWAVSETGFDPTQSGGNVPEAQRVGKRADYLRAETACLEGRGYSVK